LRTTRSSRSRARDCDVALGGSLGNLGSPEAIAAVVVLVVMALGGPVLARRESRPRPGAAR
jgi:hypothetical protein